MLREMLNSEKEYIPDDGFTNRVLGKLPATRLSPFLRYAIITAFTAVAAGIVLFIAPGFTVVTNAVIESALALARLQLPPLGSLSVVVIFTAVALLPLRLALRRQL